MVPYGNYKYGKAFSVEGEIVLIFFGWLLLQNLAEAHEKKPLLF